MRDPTIERQLMNVRDVGPRPLTLAKNRCPSCLTSLLVGALHRWQCVVETDGHLYTYVCCGSHYCRARITQMAAERGEWVVDPVSNEARWGYSILRRVAADLRLRRNLALDVGVA